MKQILIIAPQNDSHSCLIKDRLVAAGHTVRVLSTSDWPSGANGSLHYTQKGMTFIDGGDAIAFDSAWCRKISFKKNPPETINSNDAKFINSEGMLFDLGLIAAIDGVENTVVRRWINTPMTTLMADQKPFQLSIAQSCGLIIPNTLISNRPKDIEVFRRNEKRGVVIKPFNVGSWNENGIFSVSYATKISASEHISDADAASAPTTYQEIIEHSGDLRVICLDGEYISILITHDLREELDYRAVRHKTTVKYEQVDTPECIVVGLDKLRKKIGISFFCADFVIPRDGGLPVFMELNPGGQFAYLDDKIESLNIIGRFCSLLAYGDTLRHEEFMCKTAQTENIERAA